MRKKKKSYSGCNQPNYCKNTICEVKEEKNDCSCNVKSCIPNKTINKINSCKPEGCKPKIKEYPLVCDECEIKYEDKCEDLAKKAQELFEKALKYENKAIEVLKEAKNYEENARCLSQKSLSLLQNAKDADKSSKDAACKAQELMKKSEELCTKAKCLYKEANSLEKEAKENCENAKCAYEKAESYDAQAKYLYNQALKYDQKVLECYKSANEKIKEYETKAKKCEELISKCNNKLNNYNTKCVEQKTYCNLDYNMCSDGCDEEIINVAQKDNYCDCIEGGYEYSYINPMYDMTPMQYMGDMSYEYIDIESPYMMMDESIDNVNDIWSNYYMYIQKIMGSIK